MKRCVIFRVAQRINMSFNRSDDIGPAEAVFSARTNEK